MTLSLSIDFPSLLVGILIGYALCMLLASHVAKRVVNEMCPANTDDDDGGDDEPETVESDEVENDNLRRLVQLQQRKRG